ncbi:MULTISPECIES: hypothetical protein [unclassified Kaistella]|uniref:hypothetical protein n=1 Tax=unclassified Kaistella TaxID=2762626 RepID=UPI002734B060|nr:MULTISPECIES: hypothetical protein [unclassified Kaistella]MCZ2085833.1 hypothetical protein [Flavobacteriales bacterium]MDP2453674.1 hypothetical protein [Kaistella sp. SH11-4b]MDP2456731.1 hypothetical protein [Kaistella sp. SH40-3]MDP2459487.1 hypothetical protein [Kaistella sp. SH19-2b]
MTKEIILFALFGTSLMYGQVGINNESPKANLHITKSAITTQPDGLITPRLTGDELKAKDALYTADQNSTVVYATAPVTTTSTKTSNVTTPGFYYYNSGISKWVGLSMPKFFYMPSVYFDTTTLGSFSKDLYQLYYDQFTSPAAKNTSASGKIPVVGRTDLEYYITSFDATVFGPVTITDAGVVNYTVKANANDGTFLNIVFVVK